jgi:DNA repair exonuclease SbcCD ATPase subunit
MLADKFGGPKAVFQVVKGYVDYSEINNKVSQAQSELITLESEVNKLNAEYCHLETAIEMCQTLISDHKFGLDVISTTLSLAGKYGEPLIVLKSVEAYGKLEVMQEELTKLESEITKRKELLAQLEGKNNEALKQFESLNAIAMKTGAEVSKVESRLEESKHLHRVIVLINDPASSSYQEYGQLAVTILKSILKWVTSNENHFLYPNRMKSALQDLITELGGD